MCQRIINQLMIFTGLSLVFVSKEVRNYSKCTPITIKNGFFNDNMHQYECNKDYYYYMFGNETLKCQDDGSWKGEIPYCARTIPTEIWKDGNDKKVILSYSRCVEFGGNTSWEIKVNNQSFSAIRILFKANRDDIGCPVVNLSVNRYVYKERYKTSCRQNTVQFTYEFKNVMNEDIKFTLKKKFSRYFEVCGISVYSKSEEKCPIQSLYPSNGYISPSNVNSLSYGEHVSFNCNEGFQLNGYRYLYCGVTDISTQIPQCQRIQCKNSPINILNGMWENWNGTKRYFYEDEIRLICNPGYKLNATESIKCLKNGEWSHTHAACIEKKFPMYLVIIILMAVIIGLITLLIGLFTVFKHRKKKILSDSRTETIAYAKEFEESMEETVSENEYCEVNYQVLNFHDKYRPQLPTRTNKSKKFPLFL
ncbi:sushi, von Willebrand factor type A, EGF and pentraxin domain-containing protein 1-like [Centruroides sculpturatus]|uniref:sushi, von Willebrand factor type A, EGF and pentraxin domain-containing protein 1-like n=1 Tax=Centruroides sculpturatus TaxID=218467 RepID=UPI000C6E5AB0|nr:sushi, von Willebrand factor type A, EGF and pentraxin domain-containing protein 1-like [Centruroides sculpturatus]